MSLTNVWAPHAVQLEFPEIYYLDCFLSGKLWNKKKKIFIVASVLFFPVPVSLGHPEVNYMFLGHGFC